MVANEVKEWREVHVYSLEVWRLVQALHLAGEVLHLADDVIDDAAPPVVPVVDVVQLAARYRLSGSTAGVARVIVGVASTVPPAMVTWQHTIILHVHVVYMMSCFHDLNMKAENTDFYTSTHAQPRRIFRPPHPCKAESSYATTDA